MEEKKRLIDANALREKLQAHHDFFVNAWGGFSNLPVKDKARVDEITNCIAEVVNATAVDAVEVVHGRWNLEVRSYYRDTWDESCELAVYILASCSKCNCKHPDSHQVFSKTLYAPEDADDDFRFDQKAEQEKALAEFMQRGYNFANYCPNCGAKMDK